MSNEEFSNSSKYNDKCVEFQSMDAFIQDGFKIVMEATKHANALPKDRDYDFYKTRTSFKNFVKQESNQILSLMNRIMCKNNIDKNVKIPVIDEKVDLIIEANDTILERAANVIDEMNGLKKLPLEPVVQTVSAELPVNGSWNRLNRFSINTSIHQDHGKKAIHLLTAQNIIRPQKFFKDKINNSSKYPWKPRITEKPNSIKPLALYIEETAEGEIYSHPYELELERFVTPEIFLKESVPVIPKPVEETQMHEIDNEEQLNDLLEELHKHNKFAIDLEHHSYRTFMGITCLMQISTKDADYLVDTLALRDKLYILNEVFTKPTILKIFHGADSDIKWLQRDLSLYIVNMFDTHCAAKQLGYSGRSLSYLLNKFCAFMPNKKFQLADWRIRPLPEELKLYAREDTHYLIYIYEMMKNALLKQANGKDNLLKAVFQSSTEICKLRYIKPVLTEKSHLNFYRKCRRSFDNRQMFALKELYRWRDEIAREEDESIGYVLPNHMLLQIAEMMPREIQGIIACCNPIPPLIRANALQIHNILLKAREQPIEKPIMKEDNRSYNKKESTKIDVDSPLHCPHDFTKEEFRDDLPTLIGNNKENKTPMIDINYNIESSASTCSAFNESYKEITIQGDMKLKLTNLNFLGPYERYKLVRPYVQAEEAKALNKNAKLQAGEEASDDASVEDRIAALHEHFIKVKAKVENTTSINQDNIQEPQTRPTKIPISSIYQQKPLIQMEGSKKRKRSASRSAPLSPPKESIPNINQKLKETQKNNIDESNKGFWIRKQATNKKANATSTDTHKSKTKQEFKPFDYSSVNFNQFQGGAGSASGNKGTKQNFKNKGQKRNHGGRFNNNKSFTFENKRGRY